MAGPGQPGRPKGSKNKGVIEVEPESYGLFPEEDLAEVFDALPGTDKVISLYRIAPSGPPAFLVTLSPDGLRDLSNIQEEFGGGKYKAVAKNFETGEKIERAFVVEGEPKVKGGKTIVKDPKTGFFLRKGEWRNESGYETEKGNNTDPMIRLLERQLDKMEGEIASLKSERSNGGGSLTEALQLLIQAKDLIAPGPQVNQGTVDAQTIFNAMTKGMEMINNRDNENSQPAWLAVARELMPTIQQIVGRAVSASGAPRPGQPPLKSEAIPMKETAPLTGFQALVPMLEPYKQTFIDAAANDDDPSLLMPLVARRIPPDKKDEIIKWIQEGKWFGDLVSLDQRISLQRGWWEEFMKGLLAELTGVQEEEGEREVEGQGEEQK